MRLNEADSVEEGRDLIFVIFGYMEARSIEESTGNIIGPCPATNYNPNSFKSQVMKKHPGSWTQLLYCKH